MQKVITGKVRCAYIRIWEPVIDRDTLKAQYSIELIVPKSDKDTVKAIKSAITFGRKKQKSVSGKTLSAHVKDLLKDGDVNRKGNDNYADCFYIKATSQTQPGIVDANMHPITCVSEVTRMFHESATYKPALYEGCYIRASLYITASICEIDNIQILGGGEPIR